MSAAGPRHFRQAEKLVDEFNDCDPEDRARYGFRLLSEAQVHATLALVAATVGNQEQDMDLVDEAVRTWDEVLAS